VESVYSAVRNESLYKRDRLRLQRVNMFPVIEKLSLFFCIRFSLNLNFYKLVVAGTISYIQEVDKLEACRGAHALSCIFSVLCLMSFSSQDPVFLFQLLVDCSTYCQSQAPGVLPDVATL
jgi:hypothetical protein